MFKGTVLITGANGGLGSAFVSQFLKSPYAAEYHGIFTARDPSTASHLQSIITREAPENNKSNFEILPLDLSKLDSVRTFASEINKKVQGGTLPPIRALILNAAFQEANNETLQAQAYTSDGFETTFEVNYLSNFLLVLSILQSMDKEQGRIIGVSSYTHDPDDKYNVGFFATENIMYSDAETLSKGVRYAEGECKPYDAGIRRYAASKLLLVMFLYELQRRISTDPTLQHISCLALDPGAMGNTSLARRSPLFTRFLTYVLLPAIQSIIVHFWPNGQIRSPAKSAADLLWASFDTRTLGDRPQACYLNGSERHVSSPESRDEEKQGRLWRESVVLTGIGAGETVLRDWE